MSTSTPFDSDPTQELLTALGRFHRQLSNAAAQPDHPGWRDEAMNHLVEAAEVAVRQGWPDAVEALTNTGRILQTYEDGGRATECVPFLEDAYEILCLMVSDLIVDTITPSVRDKWRGRYESALLDVNLAGLSLASDSAPIAADRGAPAGVIIPFQLPETSDSSSTVEADEEELPVLDELPPLGKLIEGDFSLGDETSGKPRKSVESAMSSGLEAHEIATKVEPDAEIEQPGPTEDATRRPPTPPRIVVEVLDRMCDQLATLEKSETEKRAMHMERIEGGVQALSREAEAARHDIAERLCISMARACRLVSHDLERVSERFIDLGYAFGGVYMESLREGDTDAAQAWILECEALIHGWQVEQAERESSVASGEQTSDVHELFAFLAEQQDDAPKDAETFTPFDSDDAEDPSMLEIRVVDTPADFADSLNDDSPALEAASTGDDNTQLNEDPFAEIPAESDAAAESASQIPIDELSSCGLLDAAREATASGDGAKAKVFALRAAAQIAREEAKKAEHGLHDAESKLRGHVESTEEARATVRSQEGRVAEVERVSAQRAATLNEMQEQSAEVSSRLEEVNASVSEIETQIRELEVKRDAELDRLKACSARMNEARVQEHAASASLTEAQRDEAETRTRLEQCRQDVKSALRRTAEFENIVQSARQRLERQEGELSDIENTIHSVHAEGPPADDSEDAQLF
ncbi:MAG: hypothetical protein AAB353_00030 [Candidatus Hydrogenedentota bacterium]